MRAAWVVVGLSGPRGGAAASPGAGEGATAAGCPWRPNARYRGDIAHADLHRFLTSAARVTHVRRELVLMAVSQRVGISEIEGIEPGSLARPHLPFEALPMAVDECFALDRVGLNATWPLDGGDRVTLSRPSLAGEDADAKLCNVVEETSVELSKRRRGLGCVRLYRNRDPYTM